MIVFVGAVVIGATGAFFSDTETSTGNTFTAGAIDLGVDNHSYYNGVLNEGTTWRIDYDLSDDPPRQFFNFEDLKPGDWGEDTISLHVKNNDAYLCADVTLTSDNDNSLTEPEGDDGDTTGGVGEGELADAVTFYWWADDGDNVFEQDEHIISSGPLGALNVGQTATVALADSNENIWGGQGPLPGDSVRFVAKAWCFGNTTMTPYSQDGGNQQNGPDNRPVICDGSQVNNVTQTDSMTADISFRAVQSRNNSTFQCTTPEVTQRPTVGALLSAYVAPTSCDVTVDDSIVGPLDTIQEGVDAATAGQTVCVKAGTYTQDVNVNKSLTLVGDGSALTSLTGVGTGFGGALTVAAGIDNVTIEGFTVNGTGESAIYLTSNNDNIDVLYNRIVAATAKNALLTGGQQTNSTLSSNVFEGNAAGSQLVYVNGSASLGVVNASDNVDFLNNTFGGSGNLALGQEAGNSDVKWNKFSTVTSFTDVEDWEGGNAYNQNNFNDSGLNLQHSENGSTGDNGITNAENNWWGDIDPSDGNVNANVDVDFTPSEVSAFPQN